MEKQGYGRIINISSDSIFGMGAGGDGGYVFSTGACKSSWTSELRVVCIKYNRNQRGNNVSNNVK